MQKKIIFYDSPCPFCNRFVNFVIERDGSGQLFCAGLDSKAAKEKGFDRLDADTMVFWDQDASSFKSDAALRALAALGTGWRLVLLFRLVPRFIRDGIYDLVARHRYAGNGVCPLPSPKMNQRLLP